MSCIVPLKRKVTANKILLSFVVLVNAKIQLIYISLMSLSTFLFITYMPVINLCNFYGTILFV